MALAPRAEARHRSEMDQFLSDPSGFAQFLYLDERDNPVRSTPGRGSCRVGKDLGLSELASDADLFNSTRDAVHEALGFEETERVVFFRRSLEEGHDARRRLGKSLSSSRRASCYSRPKRAETRTRPTLKHAYPICHQMPVLGLLLLWSWLIRVIPGWICCNARHDESTLSPPPDKGVAAHTESATGLVKRIRA